MAGIEDRMDFAIGVPEDDSLVPEVRYQLLGGQVFTLSVWSSGQTARGIVPLSQLQDRVGRSDLEDGWYDHTGDFLGDDAQLPEPPAEPDFPSE